MKLSLWFHSDPSVELYRVEFERVPGTVQVSVRGKSAAGDLGTFQWTEAVRAFSLLAVGTVLAARKGTAPFALVGRSPSPAASLDFALSKRNRWLADMFGTDQSGSLIALRVFHRTNSEQRGARPVTVSLSPSLQQGDALKVFVRSTGPTRLSLEQLFEALSTLTGNQPVTAAEDLALFEPVEAAAAAVEAPPIEAVVPDSAPTAPAWLLSPWFREVVEQDVVAALRETFLLEPLGLRSTLSRLSPEYRFSPEDHTALAHSMEVAVPPPALRYGGINTTRALGAVGEGFNLEVACPLFSPGTVLLLKNIERISSGTIRINFSFPSTSTIVEHSDQFDAVVLSWNATAKLFRSPHRELFRGCALLPRTSYDCVYDPAFAERGRQYARLLVTHEQGAYPWLYYQSLIADAVPPIADFEPVDANPAEICSFLGREAAAAVVSFPFARLPLKRYGLSHLNAYEERSRIGDNVLLLSARLFENQGVREAVGLLIRESWHRLLEDRALRERAVADLLADAQFQTFLLRVSGAHSYGQWTP